MKLYTSYFGKMSHLAREGIIPVCISVGIPRFFNGAQLGCLAPMRYMLSDKWTEEEYTEMYKADVLGKVDPEILWQNILSLSKGKDIAFCCYEKSGDFCHRHILAEWLREKYGIEVEEFTGIPERKAEPDAIQETLF